MGREGHCPSGQVSTSNRRAEVRAPKWPDKLGAGFQKRLHFFRKRIWLFAFDVNRAHYVLACAVEHRNNNLRPRRTKGRQIPWIGRDVPDIHCFSRENGGACQPLGDRKRRILRCARPAPDDVRHGSRGTVHIIKPHPAISAAAPENLRDALKGRNPILRSRNQDA